MIFLIRHCTPKINYSSCDYIQANVRTTEYNSTNQVKVDEIEPLENYLNEIFEEKDVTIFSSNSPRSFATAQALFKKNNLNVISNKQFIEFDLQVIKIPFIKLKFKTWLFISRILWFCGLAKAKRTFTEEKLRAKECSEILIKEHAKHKIVVLVSHGLINMYIEKNLFKSNFERIIKVKNGNFTIIKFDLSLVQAVQHAI